MQQYYVNYNIDESQKVEFDKEQCHHLLKVLRMKSGDVVYVVDTDANKYVVELEVGDTVYGRIVKRHEATSEMGIRIYLAQGLIKGDRWDYFLQKAFH